MLEKTHFHNLFINQNRNQDMVFKREDVIKKIVLTTQKTKNIIVATTGMASRELYETRVKNRDNNKKDFLTVGGMGHASQIASGIGLTTKKK